MKRAVGIIIIFLSYQAFSQVTDDFTDGDFSNNPAWTGDAGEFIVNASQQLQLNAAVAGQSYLAVNATAATLDNTEWRFYIKLGFSPSANNNARVYLVSDQSNLEGALNGYYLQFGENLANDAIELFRQTGTGSVSVARGTDGFIAASFTIRVKVTRDNAGLWSLYADAAAGNNFTLQATGTDAVYNTNAWLGPVCTYTASNVANFYFDDFYFGPLLVDTVPPGIASVTATGPMTLDVQFNEAVEQATAETLTNYSVDNGIGNPATATLGANQTVVHLAFAGVFQSGLTHTLTVINVEDLAGNAVGTASETFIYTAPVTADPYDVVISEVFFQFKDPQGLPKAEYVEIYNRSSKTFDLAGWTIEDGNHNPLAISQAVLAPGNYLVLCDNANTALLSPFGQVAGVASFPGLNDDGDEVLIRDGSGTLIDTLGYDPDTHYNDPLKDGGGFSVERVDRNFTCANPLNWKASQSPLGGTPGKINSVTGNFSDTQPPRLARAFLASPFEVVAVFSEDMDMQQLAVLSNYSVSGGAGMPGSVTVLSPSRVRLQYPAAFDSSTVYTLTVSGSITDCPGNAIGNTTAQFGVARPATVSDVLINEVLYDPYDGGAEFIELYNRSAKVIDLLSLRLYEVNPLDNALLNPLIISSDPWLLFPQSYVVLTKSETGVTRFYETPHPDAIIGMSGFPSLNNDQDVFAVTDLSAVRIDQFHYQSGYQYPLLNDDKGVSLERISFNRPTQDSTNWHSASGSAGYATPAYENSQHTEVVAGDGEVSLSPEIFSPDNDGTDDVLNIVYRFDGPGFIANIKIYDSNGREIIHLSKNELLGISGSLSWDGIDKNREKAPVGIYIMYMEVFNALGTVKSYKKPFVLAARL